MNNAIHNASVVKSLYPILADASELTQQLLNSNSMTDVQRSLRYLSERYCESQLWCGLIDKKARRLLFDVTIGEAFSDNKYFLFDALEFLNKKNPKYETFEEQFSEEHRGTLLFGFPFFFVRNICILRFKKNPQTDQREQFPIRMIIPHLYIALNNVQHAQEAGNQHGDLSQRELQVLEWVARGKTNKEIAIILSVSQFTIKNHIANIYAKLVVVNRAQAIDKAIKLNYLSS